MTPQEAALAMGAIAAVGVVIDSLEVLSVRRQLSADGIYSFTILRTSRRFFVVGAASRPLSWLLDYPRVLALPLAQLVAAAALFALPWLDDATRRWAAAAACVVILGARMLFYARQTLGQDGADQMLLVVFSSLLVAWLGAGSAVAVVALSYAAGQLLLAYAVSGIAKAISPSWRGGLAIPGIVGTQGYGWPPLGDLLRRHESLARAACWSVIAFECLAPLALLAGTPGAYGLIVLGLCFHVGIAAVMGLNVFLWAFAACYPAVMLVAQHVGEWY